MLATDLIASLPLTPHGPTDADVSAIAFDSRKVERGTLFVALPGTLTDGHAYIDTALAAGATAILCQRLPETLRPEVLYLQAHDVPGVLGRLAARWYAEPSKALHLIGVTGTNGKTTTATLLFRLFRWLGYRCGLISTVQNQIEDEVVPSTHTTPDVLTLNALLARMKAAGCTHVFIEVSSHAVVQQRIAGLTFAGGIFTNITHDHLDFHGSFANYIAAKKGFFDALPKTAFALVNADDPRGRVMVQNTAARRESFSLEAAATFRARVLADSIIGLEMEFEQQHVHFQLVGYFNAYNLLAVYGAAVLLGEAPDEVLTGLSALTPPPGRFEQVGSAGGITGIVDYAHTPDALENVLETMTALRLGTEKIITVVGCGGNRDAAKRPLMAEIACRFSDATVLTADNPRLEDPLSILAQMQAGVPPDAVQSVEIVPDRREAIRRAVALARTGDLILVAGKGHETYQEAAGVKTHFDDREELRAAFAEKG